MMATLVEDGKISHWEAYYCRKDKKLVPIEQNRINLYNKKGGKKWNSSSITGHYLEKGG